MDLLETPELPDSPEGPQRAPPISPEMPDGQETLEAKDSQETQDQMGAPENPAETGPEDPLEHQEPLDSPEATETMELADPLDHPEREESAPNTALSTVESFSKMGQGGRDLALNISFVLSFYFHQDLEDQLPLVDCCSVLVIHSIVSFSLLQTVKM